MRVTNMSVSDEREDEGGEVEKPRNRHEGVHQPTPPQVEAVEPTVGRVGDVRSPSHPT